MSMDPRITTRILWDITLDKYTEIKVPEQTFDVIFESKTQLSGKENGQEKCRNLIFPFACSPLKNVTIKNSNILLESKIDSVHVKEISEITLNCEVFEGFNWQPGDTIAILPSNSYECVVELLKLLEFESKADTICTVKVSSLCSNKTAKVPTYIPTPTTPREILRDCLNLKSVLSKKFLRSLAEYCTNDLEKNFLKLLSSKEGSTIYNDFVLKEIITLSSILKLCESCKPPLGLIIEHLPRLLPRPYSIANSPLHSNEKITFIYSTLHINPGITTKMLKEKSLEAYSSLLMYLRKPNYFRYTEDNYKENQILIAVGTGLAPFLGFLQHKQHLMNKFNEKPGITWLFVGTTSHKSVVHRDELLKWQSQNVLNEFVEAYSRTPTAQFRSVQDILFCNKERLVKLLMKPETYLYLCADGGQISKSIAQSLKIVLAKELDLSEAESIELLKDFKTKRKYREDSWQ